MSSPSAPSPALFFDTVNAYQRTAALKTAIDLDLFTAIAQGAATAAALGQRLGGAERGVRILCDYLTGLGFLAKRGQEYALTADTAVFLDRRSPAYVGAATEFLLAPAIRGAFDSLGEAVRQGGTADARRGTVAPDHPVWVEFARVMRPLVTPAAEAMGALLAGNGVPVGRVLDVAASHGAFGIAIARRAPQAWVTAQDWSAVLEVARENARQAGVEDRFTTLPGSALEVEFGSGYDLITLTNLLHLFDAATCTRLLGKCHAALAPGGRVAILDFVPNEDRTSPPQAVSFSLAMLATTPSGDAYTLRELSEMCAAAGFERTGAHALPGLTEQLVIAHKG